MKILSCLKENEELEEEERRATQTSGIVVKVGGHWIALYANGRRHAGENLDELVKKRSAGLETPIQMAECAASRTIESLTQPGEVQRNTSGSSD